MNKKQKIVSTTLSTITALSSVTALSSMPNRAILNVQALDDENTAETTKPTQPTNKTNLEKEVEEKNTSVVSAGTILKGAETEKNTSEEALNTAKSNKEQNENKISSSVNQVDSTLAKEVKDRAQEVMQLQETLSSQKQQKEELEKTINEKQEQLKTAQDKYNEAQTEFNDQSEKNKDTLDKLTEAEKQKSTYENDVNKLNDQLTSLNKEIETVTSKLNESNKTLEDNKNALDQLTKEKQSLETQLTASIERLNTLNSLLKQQPSDEEIQQMQDEINTLQNEIDNKKTQLSDLDTEIKNLSTQIEEQKIVVNETVMEQTKLSKQYDDLTAQITTAKTNLDTAKSNYDSLKQTVDDLNNNVDTSELSQLKTELAELQKQQGELQTKVDEYTQKLSDAENELSNAYIKYNDNVVSFYKEVYRETGSLDAYHAFTELEKYDGVEYTAKSTMSGNTGTATIYDSKNYDQTMASLSDLKEAINYIKMCNAIREYEGLSPLKVSYYLMTVSAIQNQYSSVTIDHSAKYNVGENLYWRMGDYKSERFLDENGNLDVEFLNQLGRNPTQHIQRANPFYGWWIEEKVDYEKTHDSLNDGHYLNIVNGSYTLTGFSHNNQVHNDYYHTWGQVFSSRLSLQNVDGSGYTSIDGVTVDEFEKALNAWILKKANGVQIEQDNVASAKESLTNATNSLNSKKQEVANKQTAIANYKNNINAQYQTATENYNFAKKTYDDLVEKQATTKTQLDKTTNTLAIQRENLNKFSDKLEKDEKIKENLSEEISNKQTVLEQKKATFDDTTKDKNELEKTIKEVNSQIDSTNALIDENSKKTKDVTSAISSNEQNINTYNSQLSSLKNEVTNKESEKNTVSSKIDDLNKTIANYNSQLEEYNKAKQEFEKASKYVDELNKDIATAIEEQKELSNEIDNTMKKLDVSKANDAKAQKAKKQWEEIKSGNSNEYDVYDDQVLDSLKYTILDYVQEKALTSSLEIALAKAQEDFDKKNQKYLDALNVYNSVLADYNKAKSELDTFNENIGVITNDTITLPNEILYTGKQIKPDVVVKDSKGNIVNSSEYVISFGENTQLGEGTVTITMNNENYVGTFTKTFKIVDKLTAKEDKKDKASIKSNTASTSSNSTNKTSSNAVKTDDKAPIAEFGLLSMISMFFYTFLKRKEDNQN